MAIRCSSTAKASKPQHLPALFTRLPPPVQSRISFLSCCVHSFVDSQSTNVCLSPSLHPQAARSATPRHQRLSVFCRSGSDKPSPDHRPFFSPRSDFASNRSNSGLISQATFLSSLTNLHSFTTVYTRPLPTINFSTLFHTIHQHGRGQEPLSRPGLGARQHPHPINNRHDPREGGSLQYHHPHYLSFRQVPPTQQG